MAVVLPSFSLRENKLKAEARKVATIIRSVNDTAVTRKKDIPLKFEFKERIISWPEDGKDRAMRLASLEAVELPSRGLVEEGELTVFFSPLVPGETLSVHLALGEEEMTVSFNPISRRTRILAHQEP